LVNSSQIIIFISAGIHVFIRKYSHTNIIYLVVLVVNTSFLLFEHCQLIYPFETGLCLKTDLLSNMIMFYVAKNNNLARKKMPLTVSEYYQCRTQFWNVINAGHNSGMLSMQDTILECYQCRTQFWTPNKFDWCDIILLFRRKGHTQESLCPSVRPSKQSMLALTLPFHDISSSNFELHV